MAMKPGVFVVSALLLTTPAFAEDQFFDSSGVRIRYVEQGTGEPVVLIHGNGGSSDMWTRIGALQDLARNYRVVAFDARGHGKSGKPHDPNQYGREMALDIVRLLDHLRISRAHIVGYSMGAGMTAQLLTTHPDRFITATLVAGGSGRGPWTAEDAKRVEQEASELEKDCISRTQMYRLAPSEGPKPSEAEIKAASDACFANPNQDRFALAALRRASGEQALTFDQTSAVRVPTLAVVGDQDPAATGLQALKKRRADLHLVVVGGATHGGERGIVRRPEFLPALRQFIAAHHSTPH